MPTTVRVMLDGLSRGLLAFSNVLLAALFLLINFEIALRATSGRSTLISDEYSGYLFCWLTLSGFLYAMRTDAFLNVAFAVKRLSGRWHTAALAFAALGGLVVSAIALHASCTLVLTTWRFHAVSSQYSQTPLYLPQLVMPAAFALLSLAYAERLLTHIAATLGPSGRHSDTRSA